jgi:hypothetical protein
VGLLSLQKAAHAAYHQRMREMVIYYGDVWQSIRGMMLFPDDPEMARHHVAAYHIKDGISADLHRAAMERLRAERKNRQFDGDCVGEIVKVLLTLIHHHADKASWQSAIRCVSDYAWNNSECGASPSLYWKRLSRYAPVLHFWGACALRYGGLHLDDLSVGYSRDDDARAFVTEAQKVLEYLHAWDDARGKTERSSYLAVDAFGPLADMPPFEPQPEWPDTGSPRAFGPLSDKLLQRADGTPIIRPRGWQKGRARI